MTPKQHALTTIIVNGELVLVKACFNGHKHSLNDEYQKIRDEVETARCELFDYNPDYCKLPYRSKKQ